MEFLSKPENQSQIADLTGEYPVSKGARIPAYLERYGEIKINDAPLSKLANVRQAVIAITREYAFPEEGG